MFAVLLTPIVTDNKEIFAECWRYHHSGRTLDGDTKLGTNARITEFQACVLSEQLARMPGQLKKRNENAQYLINKLKNVRDIILPCAENDGNFDYVHSWFLFQLLLDANNKSFRNEFIKILTAEGIPITKAYPNLSHEKFLSVDNSYFRKLTGSIIDYSAAELPKTDTAAESAMWLSGRVFLGEFTDMDDIAEAFYKALNYMN